MPPLFLPLAFASFASAYAAPRHAERAGSVLRHEQPAKARSSRCAARMLFTSTRVYAAAAARSALLPYYAERAKARYAVTPLRATLFFLLMPPRRAPML